MKKTNVETIDGALDALNVARSYLDEDALPITYWPEEREVEFDCAIGSSNRELDAFLNLTCEAVGIVNLALRGDPRLRIATDWAGRWVAIRTE